MKRKPEFGAFRRVDCPKHMPGNIITYRTERRDRVKTTLPMVKLHDDPASEPPCYWSISAPDQVDVELLTARDLAARFEHRGFLVKGDDGLVSEQLNAHRVEGLIISPIGNQQILASIDGT